MQPPKTLFGALCLTARSDVFNVPCSFFWVSCLVTSVVNMKMFLAFWPNIVTF